MSLPSGSVADAQAALYSKAPNRQTARQAARSNPLSKLRSDDRQSSGSTLPDHAERRNAMTRNRAKKNASKPTPEPAIHARSRPSARNQEHPARDATITAQKKNRFPQKTRTASPTRDAPSHTVLATRQKTTGTQQTMAPHEPHGAAVAKQPQRHEKVKEPQHLSEGKPHSAATSRHRMYCGNNALDPDLESGKLVLGTRSACFRKGVGGALHQAVPLEEQDAFIKKWTSPYKKLVDQPLHYGDGPAPNGKIAATLSQSLARGWAVGSIQKAKRLLKEKHSNANTGKPSIRSNSW